MKHPVTAAAVVALLHVPIVAHAQSDAETEIVVEEEVVVSANRYEVPASRVGSSVTVIELDEIEQRAQSQLTELLRTVPGVEVTQTGGAGKIASVRVRGSTAQQALILIDDVRVNTAINGGVDFSHLTSDNLERIEVLRGPQAAYGSEAMSGVISITTRRGDAGWRAKATIESGTHDHERLELGLSGGQGLFDYSLSGSDFSTTGVSHRSGIGNSEPDPYENQTYSGRFGVAFLEDGRVDLSVRSYEGDTALDGFFGEDLNASAQTDGTAYTLSVEKNFASFWRQTLRYGESETDIIGTDPDTVFNNYAIFSGNRQLDLQSDVSLSDSNVLNFGYTAEDREGETVGGLDESTELDSWFVQDQWSVTDSVHLTAAVRRDDHSVFDGEISYRVTGAGSTQGGRTRIRGSYGTAFRAPNLNELYFPFSGNLTLQPETSRGFDLGLHHHLASNRWSFDLTYFDLDFDDLIQFEFATFTFQNVAQASSEGVELQVGYRHGTRVDLSLGHTYNRTEDKASGDPLARRPKNRTTLVARYAPTERLDGAASVAAVSDRIDSTGLEMDDYTRLDLSLRYRALDWLQPWVRIDNALGEEYEEVPGFTTPGRVYVVGLTFRRD